eukprot:TRINITY_DN82460_c0_g1_i1.p1 TRINITY_DN82460_c0_g1~~TRINITY_DN82460_c0_g1_i1.p1  ORF type:complete len:328 (-),score=40.61 TRINITY_DN82460_c0_g1_i1:147-1130(-)
MSKQKDLQALRATILKKHEQHVKAHPDTLLFWRNLHDNEGRKDVEIQASDGTVKAHGLLLESMSEAFRAMLTNGMVESRTKRIRLSEYTTAQIDFFLRVASIGVIEDSDLDDPYKGSSESEKVVIKVTAACEDGPPAILEFIVRCHTPLQRLMTAWCSRQRIPESGVTFLVDGCVLRPADTIASIGHPLNEVLRVQAIPCEAGSPPQGPYCTATKKSSEAVKLDLLFGGAAIARQYMVGNLLERFTDRLKLQLSPTNFDTIMDFAIKQGMAGLHYFCLRFAELEPAIKKLYDNGKVSEAVAQALREIWPETRLRFKRLKTAKTEIVL